MISLINAVLDVSTLEVLGEQLRCQCPSDNLSQQGRVAFPTWRTWFRWSPSTTQSAGKDCSRSSSLMAKGRLSQWKGPVDGPG